PSIRGWNRISIFISFASLAAFFCILQEALERASTDSNARRLGVLLLVFSITVFGLWDQTVAACTTCLEQNHRAFRQNAEFVAGIEAQLEPGGAVYQLPYMPFPEVPPLHKLQAYELG